MSSPHPTYLSPGGDRRDRSPTYPAVRTLGDVTETHLVPPQPVTPPLSSEGADSIPSPSHPAVLASFRSPPISHSRPSHANSETEPLLSADDPRTDPNYGVYMPTNTPGSSSRSPLLLASQLVPVGGPPEEAAAALLMREGEQGLKRAEALLCVAGTSPGLPQRDKEEEAIEQLFKGFRAASQETSNAKIIEWISLFFGIAATLAPILLGSLRISRTDLAPYKFLVAAVGSEAFLAYALPAGVVLWNLYANDNEEINSPKTLSTNNRAVVLVNISRLLLAVFLIAVSAVSFHAHQEEDEGGVDPTTVKRTVLLTAICQLATSFVFGLLGVYKWLAARHIGHPAMQADAITCFIEVLVSLVNGWAHFYNSVVLAKEDSIDVIARQRARHLEYFGISAAVSLLGLSAFDMCILIRTSKAPVR